MRDIAIELANEIAKRRADPDRAQYLNTELEAGRMRHVSDVEIAALWICFHLEELTPTPVPTGPVDLGWLDLGAFAHL